MPSSPSWTRPSEASKAEEEFKSQIADARHEAARIREEAREQGAQIIAEMREQAQAEAARIAEHAHVQIDADRKAAMAQLRGEVGTPRDHAWPAGSSGSLDDDVRQSRVVDRFLPELEGASRWICASLRRLLRGAGRRPAGGLRAGSHAEQVAGELFTVAQVLRDEPALRRVATDASLAAEMTGRAWSARSSRARSTAPPWTWSRRRPGCVDREPRPPRRAGRDSASSPSSASVGDQADRLADEVFSLSRTVTSAPSCATRFSRTRPHLGRQGAAARRPARRQGAPATLALADQALAGTHPARSPPRSSTTVGWRPRPRASTSPRSGRRALNEGDRNRPPRR